MSKITALHKRRNNAKCFTISFKKIAITTKHQLNSDKLIIKVDYWMRNNSQNTTLLTGPTYKLGDVMHDIITNYKSYEYKITISWIILYTKWLILLTHEKYFNLLQICEKLCSIMNKIPNDKNQEQQLRYVLNPCLINNLICIRRWELNKKRQRSDLHALDHTINWNPQFFYNKFKSYIFRAKQRTNS